MCKIFKQAWLVSTWSYFPFSKPESLSVSVLVFNLETAAIRSDLDRSSTCGGNINIINISGDRLSDVYGDFKLKPFGLLVYIRIFQIFKC